MRRKNETDDKPILTLLNEGAKAAAESAGAQKQLQHLHEQVRSHQYALMNAFKTLQTYPAVKQQVDQLDYRTLGVVRAMEKIHPGFSQMVEDEARASRVDAFQELSDADDLEKGLIVDDEAVVDENCYVIFTSECKADPDQGVFRSKMDAGGGDFAPVKEALFGKKKGDVAEAKIMGNDHLVTILGVRKKPTLPESETPNVTDNTEK